MAYMNDDQGGRPRGPRQMFDVTAMNLKCAECGKPITELPFQPSPDRPVYCREDNMKRRKSFGQRSF